MKSRVLDFCPHAAAKAPHEVCYRPATLSDDRPPTPPVQTPVIDAPGTAAAVSLPCPLPGHYAREPATLTEFRGAAEDDKAFNRLRRQFRDDEDWRSLATLLVLHAAATAHVSADARGKAAELCVQAHELWLERVKDRSEAAFALARALQLRPDNLRTQERLRKLYEAMGAHRELAELLRWRVQQAPNAPSSAPLHLELGELFEQQFLAIGQAVEHYELAVGLDGKLTVASDRLIKLYSQAGAWNRAAARMTEELARIEPAGTDRARIAELHRRLASIESGQFERVAAAARHLQGALKAVPEDIEALRAFGALYLSSGKATDDGVGKAADIFYKAAELARRRGNKASALKLLRRALALAPEHPHASAALETTLIDAEEWMALDELYQAWLRHLTGADTVPLLLRRADLLDRRLYRREDARALYEEASRFQRPDDEAWRRLEQIYSDTGDYWSLVALLDAQIERLPDEVPIATLLRAAQVCREELGDEERAAVYYYRVLEREPFDAAAFEGYKEHWRRKHNWGYLRDLILFQVDQAGAQPEGASPYDNPAFAEEFVELADICERRLGDIDGALAAWGRLQVAYPDDQRPAKHVARIEKRARMWDNMVRVQEAELERTVDPAKRLDILKRLTQVYRDRQVNPERVIELYSEILQLSPNDIQATRALTALYDRAGDFPAVIDMLREQYERSRSGTERIALLRRMAEIWHNELGDNDNATWACEQILALAPDDREALYRMQQVMEQQRRFPELLDTLARELRATPTPDAKAKVLRRMARIAELELDDEDRAASLWLELLELRPGSLEITDKLVAVYERAGRNEDLCALLTKAASAAKTPPIRQIDYLWRLGQLAETTLEDPTLARSSFERLLRSRPDHRGALEALVRIYRQDGAWQPLVAALGKLQELAETEDDAFRLAWERAEILGDDLDDPSAAAELLESLGEELAIGRPQVATSLLELYQRAGAHRKAVRQAEVLLLAAQSTDERRKLYETISTTWLRELGDKQAAIAAYGRFIAEFSTDLDGLATMAGLQQEVGDHEAALTTLGRRLELADEGTIAIETLRKMARIAEQDLGDPRRALEYLRRALARDHFHAEAVATIDRIAEQHGLWPELLAIMEERFGYCQEAGDPTAAVELCMAAIAIAEKKCGDPKLAFAWAERAYFAALAGGISLAVVGKRMRGVAADHRLWSELAGALERELALLERHGPIDAHIARLREASALALERLDDPNKAVAYLQRAHRLLPTDEVLAEELERTAARHGLWQAAVELWAGRLRRTDSDAVRFVAYKAIARIYEDELHDSEKAFEWLKQAWIHLRKRDVAATDEAYDLLLELVKRHQLWAQLCEFELERARFPDAPDAIAALRAAAEIFAERLSDPLSAMRSLAHGLDEADGEELLPEIRRLGERIDEERAGAPPAIGALFMLQVLQRLVTRSRHRDRTIELLRERAELREHRLSDQIGAMAEWIRVLRLDPDHDEAVGELERLADDGGLWPIYLLVPAAALEVELQPDAQAVLLKRIAQLYEGVLGRPEYALRARLQAWRTHPALPPEEGEIDDEHAAIWRLAELAGAYHTPPVPRDALLMPALSAPEVADQAAWISTGLDPRLLDAMPSPHAARADLVVEIPAASDHTAEVVVAAAEHTGSLPIALEQDIGLDEELAIEDLEDLDEAGELPSAEATVSVMLGVAPSHEDRTRTRITPVLAPPPPPPRAPDHGLPPLPRLTRPILPPRPRVASAWEEVALAYTELPAESKLAKVDVALVLARVWEEGANNLERAFQALERALLWVPRHDVALARLEALAARHGVLERLLQAYELLLSESAVPEHIVAHNVRIAELQTERGDLPQAESRWRAVLGVAPNHVLAMRSLLDIFELSHRWADWVDVYADLLELEAPEVSSDERIARTLRLCQVLEVDLVRPKDAIERLEQIVREFPARRDIHDALISNYFLTRQWQPAIEAMRAAAELARQEGDHEAWAELLARVATVYEERLALPDRAIGAWAEIADAGDNPRALEKLTELYLATGRFEPALPIIERRLAALGDAGGDTRIALLVAKARALQEQGGDSQEAVATLEELCRVAPENDEVVVGLSRLYRKLDRFEAGVELLRRHELHVRGLAEPARHIRIALVLAEVLDREGHDPRGALASLTEVLAIHPGSGDLLRAQVKLARAVHDERLVVESLAALPDPDGHLEAADIMRTRLHDSARAVRLYSRVLAEAKASADDPEAPRRLASALEGLVKLRVDDGDIVGAMEFMDRQLAEMKGPAIRAQLLTEMGRITYRSTGDVASARTRFDAALAEDPEYARAKLGLGEMLAEAGRHDEAEALLEQAVDALGLIGDPKQLAAGLLALARVLEQSGRHADAQRRLTLALRHCPDDLEIRAALVRNRVLAGRNREALSTADGLVEKMALGFERTPSLVRRLSDTLALVAQSAVALKQYDDALVRYRLAIELDPGNPNALEPLIGLCQERGALSEAARAAATLARQLVDPRVRGQKFIEAGMLFHDAAATLADGGEAAPGETEGELRKAAFENIRLGLELLEEHNVAALDRAQLEVAFHATAPHDPSIALRCLDRLLLQPDLTRERRHDLMLEGVDIALRGGDDYGHGVAERLATTARDLQPNSPAAVLAQARVLESAGRIDEIEPLVETYFRSLGRRTRGPDSAVKIALLLRLAEIQRAHPEKAIASLEHALELDPNALGPGERHHLADLYAEVGQSGPRVLGNHVELLVHEPLAPASLAALAEHHVLVGDVERARALYEILALSQPDHPLAAAFLANHEVIAGGSAEVMLTETLPAAPPDAGITEALLTVLDGGAGLLSESLPRIDVPQEARVSPLGDSLLARCWGEVLKRLGTSKVALVAEHALSSLGEGGPEREAGAWFQTRCQQPPIIIAFAPSFVTEDADALRFGLARALYYGRPENVFAMGVRRATLAKLLSALLQAFHPRHSRRKHHQRAEDETGKLSQELLRKLPMRTARQLSALLKEHEAEPFDSRAWRGWIRRAGNRVGLIVGGDLAAALRQVAGSATTPLGETLAARVADDEDVRDLVAFAGSAAYSTVRRQLGYELIRRER